MSNKSGSTGQRQMDVTREDREEEGSQQTWDSGSPA